MTNERQMKILEQHVKNLTPLQKDIVNQIEGEGLTIPKAARQLSIPVVTCEREYHAATNKIMHSMMDAIVVPTENKTSARKK